MIERQTVLAHQSQAFSFARMTTTGFIHTKRLMLYRHLPIGWNRGFPNWHEVYALAAASVVFLAIGVP